MARPSFSIIVVSRGRPASLVHCLTSLVRLAYAPYEIIVVADPEGLTALEGRAEFALIRRIPCDTPNISRARNLGVSAAGGEVLAFIDDDAVAEPGWLAHLARAFEVPSVAAATGFTRGPDGIRFQSRAAEVLGTGQERALQVDPRRITFLHARPGRAIKTEGTNMAFRRGVLEALGGFDPAFAFYMDETDLNLRLSRHHAVTAIAPLAEVHHARAPGPLRAADRAPLHLARVGVSTARFLARHCPAADFESALAGLRAERRRGLLGHMVAGRLEPGDVLRLLSQFDSGAREGQADPRLPVPGWSWLAEVAAEKAAVAGEFRAYPTLRTAEPVVIATRRLFLRRNLALAEALAARGRPVSLFAFSPTCLAHKVRMTEAGVWLQEGGTFGNSPRTDRGAKFWHMNGRFSHELARISEQRWQGDVG
ncbi:glycosyltransferase [Pseudooceanicola sp. HF7]|uniref:glycosyltransferase family 2 protein n=1 Tax=Pseudooceanicola sp. HF7 TaxID=2721560 RepID=UPI001430C630|nr:glycosyltransferase [Pseudooceanicola sp. HF7]